MRDTSTPTVNLSIRIPRQLDLDLKRAAIREANSVGAVVRRLVATGLSRELRTDPAREQESGR
jgi:hypothetical protein